MKIANIVAVTKMKKSFDLDFLSSKLDNTEFNKSKTWLKMRLKPKNNYVAFYASGKFLVTGVKSLIDLDDIIKRVIQKLRDSDINIEIDKITVSNIVLTDEIDFHSSLDVVISSLNSNNSSYEPEQFPGLFYKDVDGINYTLFTSGKIIMTGFKNLDVAKKNLKKFKELIGNIVNDSTR